MTRSDRDPNLTLRDAHPEEFSPLGQLMVQAYAALPGFPPPEAQPAYYAMLANIGSLAAQPDTRLLVAVSEGRLLGGVVYFSDMARYGSGGTATQERDASGFRLLAVAPEARGKGVGRALMEHCISLAREQHHAQVVIHTTQAMQTAWKMYESRGFERSKDLDFRQGELPVFGFRLRLEGAV